MRITNDPRYTMVYVRSYFDDNNVKVGECHSITALFPDIEYTKFVDKAIKFLSKSYIVKTISKSEIYSQSGKYSCGFTFATKLKTCPSQWLCI